MKLKIVALLSLITVAGNCIKAKGNSTETRTAGQKTNVHIYLGRWDSLFSLSAMGYRL